MRLQRLVRVYTCQNIKLLEISCRGSYSYKRDHVIFQPEDLIPATATGQPGKSALKILDLETLVPESVTKKLQQMFSNFVAAFVCYYLSFGYHSL